MMTRTFVLATLLGSGALSIAVFGQAPAEPPASAIAATKIERVKENLYVITGFGPGRQLQWGQHSRFHHRRRSHSGRHKTARVWSNHPRADPHRDRQTRHPNHQHTRARRSHGNNRFFGADIEIITHENADATMRRAKNLQPRATYHDKRTIGTGAGQIDLYHFGRGHTDGDTFVVFTALRTLHAGDQFPWKALPFIDAGIGGSVLEHPKTLAAALQAIRDVDTVVGGHMPISTWDDLREYADFVQDFATYAERAMKAGKSVDEATAEYQVPPRFKGYSATAAPNLSVRTNMQLAYNELAKQ